MLSRILDRLTYPRVPRSPKTPWGMAGWAVSQVQGDEYLFTRSITMTGALLNTVFPVPFYHTLMEVRFIHLTALNAPSTQALDINFSLLDPSGFYVYYWNVVNGVDSYYVISFMDEGGRSFAGGTKYQVGLDCDAGEIVKVTMRLRVDKD